MPNSLRIFAMRLAMERAYAENGGLDQLPIDVDHAKGLQDYELIAQELSSLAEKVSDLKERMAEVEQVNARLEEAALITAQALQEISGHWDAVYGAMRRKEPPQEAATDPQAAWKLLGGD
jgi:hypothetical protein